MHVNVTKEGQTVFFEIIGKIDEQGAEELKKLFQQLNLTITKEVVFNFHKVEHIGSAGIGKLLLFYKDLSVNGGIIRVEKVSNTVYELLHLVKLDTVFEIKKMYQ